VIKTADKILPADTHERLARHGRTYMGVTYPDPKGNATPKSGLVGNFTSRADFIECMAASIYLPLFSGPWVTTL
jgi:hypothetical protein